ncbi:glycosyltransferase, partial [bacterium]|nr:glycosyltransferase [bacterium]
MIDDPTRSAAPAADAVLVNVGCGDQPLPGFVNLDLDRDADLKLDVRRGLPFADGTVDGIHSEHFVEHLTQGELLAFLRECRRALRPGGVVRVATPDLAEIVRCYLDPDWHERCGLKDYGYDWLANPCEMLNVCLRDWGHKHVVDAAELKRLARLAGLAEPVACATGESNWPYFQGVETRLGRHLVMEFRRPVPAPHPAAAPPLVSVLIAAYEPRWFEAALLSARAQTHARLEILVGDDSPGDEIEAVCRRHAAEDPRVSYVRNPAVLGEIDNWQALYERARGDYVKCLADDDLLEPPCVARLVAALAGRREATLAASYRRLID